MADLITTVFGIFAIILCIILLTGLVYIFLRGYVLLQRRYDKKFKDFLIKKKYVLTQNMELQNAPDVSFVFHRYFGLTYYAFQRVRHDLSLPYPLAKAALRKLHNHNLTWGNLVIPLVVPVLSEFSYRVQLRKIEKQFIDWQLRGINFPKKSKMPLRK
ncbi:MAG: hypothetical protein MPJ24_08720 [Pirellulaceae bacterium]|nr:hypothetical protein [Pirellulaceae bacterium]